MINAKRANKKAYKAQRKNFKNTFSLLKFSIKEHARRGENESFMFLDEFCQTENDVNLVVNYFKNKNYNVSIEDSPALRGVRQKL